jgi:hypothetical protein
MLNRLTTIKLSDVRERTKMQLRLQNTTEHDDYIDVLVHEGLRHINSLYQLDKQCCELPVVDSVAQLPKGFVKLLGLVMSCNETAATGGEDVPEVLGAISVEFTVLDSMVYEFIVQQQVGANRQDVRISFNSGVGATEASIRAGIEAALTIFVNGGVLRAVVTNGGTNIVTITATTGFPLITGVNVANTTITQTTQGIGAYEYVATDNFTTGNSCSPILYADTKFLLSCGCDCDSNWRTFDQTFQISDGYIYLRSNIEVDTVKLAYMGLNVDSDGDMVVYEDFERGLMSYASWMFASAYYDIFPMSLADTYRRTWVAQKSWLKGAAQKENFEENKREIQNIFKSLLVSNLVNI